MNYYRIETATKSIYRQLTPETMKELEPIIKANGSVEILNIDQEYFGHRLEMANNFKEYQECYDQFYGMKTDMTLETFNKISLDRKLSLFDSSFGLPL
jgi:hypothetical protein